MNLKSQMRDEIIMLSESRQFPDDTSYRSLAVETVVNLSGKFGIPGQHVEIVALEEGIVPERYARNMKTFSPRDQATLLKSQVSVVGLGGLGGAVIEILARVGIGTLKLIDGDTFEDSNLNRQFLSAPDMLENSKAKTAAKRVNWINASVVVQTYFENLTETNAIEYVDNSDVVVDCLDNLKTRFVLESASKKIGSPFVSSAVAGVSGHVTTIFPEDEGLVLIYGKDGSLVPKGAEASLGCLPQAVTVLAALECSEVIKIILNRGDTLRNRLLIIDLMDNTLEVLKLL
ncbi:ThiF family adenylyltransferase [Thermodesulfobacteriota bacterium]